METIKQRQFWVEHYNDEKYVIMRNKILEVFQDLIFYEGPHKYYYHGKEITCVSNVTHMFVPKFDADKMAQETYERNFDNEKSKYYQMTPEMIKESWLKISKDACSLGTDRHLFAESLFYFTTGQLDRIPDEFKDRLEKDENGEFIFVAKENMEIAALKFYKDLPDCYIPILAETKVIDLDLNYCGTFDLLMYYDAPLNGKDDNQSGLLVLDWKSNADLYKNFKGQKMLEPFTDLLNMPLSTYKLQLSLYQNCLEKIGFKIVSRKLMWLKRNGVYELIPLESYVNVLVDYLTKHPIV